MCCLAYEEDFYKVQIGQLPMVDSVLECEGKRLRVNKVDIFTELFVVIDDDGNETTIPMNQFGDYRVIDAPALEAERQCLPGVRHMSGRRNWR